LFFGIRLPVNFFSPYKATSIIEFWRRWHISLSRFLRDYLYIPLGGNRRGVPRRYLNVMVTMALAGLWHGAGWTFVVWGTLHGAMLVVNHAWRALRAPAIPPLAGGVVTFVAVVSAWVFFRAETFAGAGHLLRAMAGADGVLLPAQLIPYLSGLSGLIQFSTPGQHWLGPLPTEVVPLLIVVGVIAFVAPNVPQLFPRYVDTPIDVAAERPRPALTWRFRPAHAAALGAAAFWSLALLARPQEFLYFNF
jgi:hypothetical protein